VGPGGGGEGGGQGEGDKIKCFFFVFGGIFWQARVCWPLVVHVAHFFFWGGGEVWIGTQRAAVATHFPT
jgi:hypothetical protein